MAGPIQTAIGSMLNTATGALAIGKKLSDDERQASEKAAKESEAAKKAEAEKAEAEKAERKLASDTLKEEKAEASAVATEADVRLLGGSPEAAKAYRLAQERGLANPKRLIYDEEGNIKRENGTQIRTRRKAHEMFIWLCHYIFVKHYI